MINTKRSIAVVVMMASSVLAQPSGGGVPQVSGRTFDRTVSLSVVFGSPDAGTIRFWNANGTVNLPTLIQQPGDLEGTDSDDSIVLVGSIVPGPGPGQVPQGVIQVVNQTAPGTFVTVGTHLIPLARLVGVAWSQASSRLFVLDAAGGTILEASYTPGAPPPTAWTPVVTTAEEPALAAADHLTLDVETDGADPVLIAGHHGPLATDVYKITVASTGISSTTVLGRHSRSASIADEVLVPGQTSVTVTGPPSTQVHIFAGTGPTYSIAGTGTTDSDGNAVITTSPLVLGQVYVAKSALYPEPTAPFLAAQLRIGTPDAIDAATTIAPFDGGMGMGHQINNSVLPLGVLLPHTDPANAVVPASYPARLVVGTLADVTLLPDGRWYLARPPLVITTADVDSTEYPGVGIAFLEIPDDPALVGSIFCYQWQIDVGSQTRLSDICGVEIRPEDP